MAIDISAEFQKIQIEEQARRDRKDVAQVNLDALNVASIQLLLDVYNELSNVILLSGYPVAKAFYQLPERPLSLLALLPDAPMFDAAAIVSAEGDGVPLVTVFNIADRTLRADVPESAQLYFIRWIAEHEQIKA